MIPTREQIGEHYSVNALAWLCAMRAEIDRLTADLKAARDDEVAECERADRNANAAAKVTAENDELLTALAATEAERDRLTAELAALKPGEDREAAIRAWEAGYITSGETMEDAVRRLVGERDALAKAKQTHSGEINLLQNQLQLAIERTEKLCVKADSAEHWERVAKKAEAALAKATTDTRAKAQNELRSIERALCSADVLNKFAALSRGTYECHVKNTIETAISALRDDAATTPYSPPFEGNPKDCAFKTTPAPEREAAIRAWEEEATLHRCGSRFDDDDPRATYLMARSEITAAVALMRSDDGKALLRELRAWIIDEKWCAPGIVRKIDEMLAQPAPSHVYSRGKTIAESAVEQPAAAVPAHVPDAGKMVPDDTRELVAQLADAIVTLCDGQGFGVTLSEVQAIAAKLRGGA